MQLELNRQNIENLEKENSAPAISIYLPLAKTLAARKKDRVNLENLLKSAARKIIAAGSDKQFAREFVEPGFKLAHDHFAWKTKSAGMAVFIAAPQILRYFELPLPPKQSVYTGKGFDTARAKKIMEKCRGFYVLAASKNRLAFYRGENGKLRELKLAGLPKKTKDLLPGRDPEKTLQSHGAPMGKRAIFHGHGKGKDTRKEILIKYFKIADKIICRHLAKENAPLVFAGADDIFSIWRQASTYPQLVKKNLKGNFEQAPPEIVSKKALNLLKNAPR